VVGDRHVRPTSARLERARAAGFRPYGPALRLGLVLWATSLFARQQRLPSVIVPWDRKEPEHIDPEALLELVSDMMMLALGLGLAIVLLTIAAAGLGGGGIGPRRRAALRALNASPTRASILLIIGLAGAVVLASLGAWFGVLAGAARAPDATGSSLSALWTTWAVNLPWSIGSIFVALGSVELVFAVRRWIRSLGQTPDQRREELREQVAGRGRG